MTCSILESALPENRYISLYFIDIFFIQRKYKSNVKD